MKKPNFFKTTITIQVLHDKPISSHSLEDIIHEGDVGDFVLKETKRLTKTITNKKMVQQLYEFGSDPTFFSLDENGKEIF